MLQKAANSPLSGRMDSAKSRAIARIVVPQKGERDHVRGLQSGRVGRGNHPEAGEVVEEFDGLL